MVDKTLNQKELIELVGKFFIERDIFLILPYLHKGIIYTNVWANKTPNNGMENFVSYFMKKFTTLIGVDLKISYEVQSVFSQNTRFLKLYQYQDDSYSALVMVKFKEGKIYSIQLFPKNDTDSVPHKPPLEWIECNNNNKSNK